MSESTTGEDVSGSRGELVDRFRAGEEGALARAITLVENQAPGFEALLDALREGVGRAHRIGITGPPGAGKSTLVAGLARLYRDRGERVGVIAVDPSSPFTGGALLGDRVRMSELATEPGIFIRSMASRGSAGGLATSTREVADLMDAFGFARMILETVGVGQSELEIATSADSTVLVLVPESGDGIQTMKAGLMEVADLFVVNKADRQGADRLRKEIEVSRALSAGFALRGVPPHHGVELSRMGRRRGVSGRGPRGTAAAHELDAARWRVPVLMCVASRGEGLDELAAALDEHLEWLRGSGRLADGRRAALLEQARSVLTRAVERRARACWDAWLEREGGTTRLEDTSPYALARKLYRELWPDGNTGPEDGPAA
ncbi:MAG: methylmalonyl Co-A mutase-associated GTPase MeaB [Gemmatimonadota bacterium]